MPACLPAILCVLRPASVTVGEKATNKSVPHHVPALPALLQAFVMHTAALGVVPIPLGQDGGLAELTAVAVQGVKGAERVKRMKRVERVERVKRVERVARRGPCSDSPRCT